MRLFKSYTEIVKFETLRPGRSPVEDNTYEHTRTDISSHCVDNFKTFGPELRGVVGGKGIFNFQMIFQACIGHMQLTLNKLCGGNVALECCNLQHSCLFAAYKLSRFCSKQTNFMCTTAGYIAASWM